MDDGVVGGAEGVCEAVERSSVRIGRQWLLPTIAPEDWDDDGNDPSIGGGEGERNHHTIQCLWTAGSMRYGPLSCPKRKNIMT